MEQKLVSARVLLNPYVNKVLSIVKIKYGLNTKSEALNKFIELHGTEVLEKEANIDYARNVIEIANRHLKKYGYRKMSLHELNQLTEAD